MLADSVLQDRHFTVDTVRSSSREVTGVAAAPALASTSSRSTTARKNSSTSYAGFGGTHGCVCVRA